jgi:type I restriction enzyme S subunit
MPEVITDNLDLWTSALLTKSTAGRGSNGKLEAYGIKKLRELILELAVRGKLVPQDANDEPASVLLKKIADEKVQLIKEKKIRKQEVLPEIEEVDAPHELPIGWEWGRLGDICTKLTDGSHNPPSDAGEGYPMLSSQNVFDGQIDFQNPSRFVSEDDFEKENQRTQIMPDDVLLTIVASLGRSAVVPNNAPKFVLQRSVAVLQSRLVPRFFALQLVSPHCLNYYDIHGKGTAQKGIYLGKLALMGIAVPPLAEQRRIVAKVDELMALCDQLEQQQTDSLAAHQILVETLLGTLTRVESQQEFSAAWARIANHFDTLFTTEASIDHLKQTILQLAVMGKLIPQDPNDEPASVLLKRIAEVKQQLVEAREIPQPKKLPTIGADAMPFRLPNGWQWAYVWDVAKIITSGSRDWAKHLSSSGAIFVTMGNLTRGDYRLRLDSLRYVNPPPGGEGSRTRLEANDLLISITGDVGNLGLIPEGFGEAYINQHTCLLRFMPDCQNRYFPELMRSPWAKFQFDAPQRGVKNSFRLSDVGEMLIPIPPLPEQHRIVAKVDELMALCDALKARLADAQTTQLHLADAIVEQAVC